MAGLAMQVAGSSRPASGAEHLFDHLWELEGLAPGAPDGPPASHGDRVGVATIAIVALYERLLRRELHRLDAEALVAAWPAWEAVERQVRAAHTTPGLDRAAVAESRAKHIDAEALARRLALLQERWPALRERLSVELVPAKRSTIGCAPPSVPRPRRKWACASTTSARPITAPARSAPATRPGSRARDRAPRGSGGRAARARRVWAPLRG